VYKSNLSFRFDMKTTREPSGDQMGMSSTPASKVSRLVRSPLEPHSVLLCTVRDTTARRPSGETLGN
jgi:hypothetical protein